jgi:hypothetical protein
MGWESSATVAVRLHRICDTQPMLREEILPLLAARVEMESHGWSHETSASLPFDMLVTSVRDDSCPSDHHDVDVGSPSNAADQLGNRVTELQPSLAAQLLMTIESQTSALALVIAAHERGAITLPASLLALVSAAHGHLPGFLNG